MRTADVTRRTRRNGEGTRRATARFGRCESIDRTIGGMVDEDRSSSIRDDDEAWISIG
jgi:hypothetical protein